MEKTTNKKTLKIKELFIGDKEILKGTEAEVSFASKRLSIKTDVKKEDMSCSSVYFELVADEPSKNLRSEIIKTLMIDIDVEYSDGESKLRSFLIVSDNRVNSEGNMSFVFKLVKNNKK